MIFAHPLKASLHIFVTAVDRTIFERLEHLAKELCPILVTFSAFMTPSFEQLLNTSVPKEAHSENSNSPSINEHPPNTEGPKDLIWVNLLGINVDNELHP